MEDYIDQILKLENEAISPAWTHGALLSEVYNEDSHFILALEESDALSENKSNAASVRKSSLSKVPACDNACSLLGFAILRQVGDDGELLQIAVRGSARRRGVGDLLIGNILQHAIDKAYLSVFLEVRTSNDAAIRLYEKHGFSTLRIRKDYYTDPIEDANIMVNTFN